jgi:hypothetical protein
VIFEQILITLQIASYQAIYVGDSYVDDYQVLLDPQQRYSQVPDRIRTVFDLVPYLKQLHQ